MNKTISIVFTLFISCTWNAERDGIHDFKPNTNLKDIWTPLKEITTEKDYCIIYSEGGGVFIDPGSLNHKLFCHEKGSWQKIHIKRGAKEHHYFDGEIETIEKDLTFKKVCSAEEAEYFLNNLIKLGFFSLEEENVLVKKCEEKRGGKIRTNDSGSITLYLVKGKKVRMMTYNDIDQKWNDCPEIPEIKAIHDIAEFFKNNWYLKNYD
jgi:hypothetical protein